MFRPNAFSRSGVAVELDGRRVPPASMATKGVALAVDLSLAVGVASLLFYLISIRIPLDTPAARTPLGLVAGAAVVYLALGRDHLFSAGRRLLRLQLVRLPGHVPGLLGRTMSVHRDPVAGTDTGLLTRCALVIALGTALSVLSLAGSLTTTRMLHVVHEHARTHELVAGRGLTLARLPRALLVGQERGYVQIDARGPSGDTILEYFLLRDRSGWQVHLARETQTGMSANYSLGIRDADIPPLP